MFILFIISGVYAQCLEMNEIQCHNDDDCDWVESITQESCYYTFSSYLECLDNGCLWYSSGTYGYMGSHCYGTYFADNSYCEESQIPEDSTCDGIQNSYESIHINSEYTDCNYDNDCTSVWGHCGIGLGGCHYTINNQYPQNEVNDLAEEWLNGNCMEWECDCMGLPYAQCVDGHCSSAYCIGENPAGCFETGCDEGFECIPPNEENDCIPSSCFCDESTLYGSWSCTEDCGGGICVPNTLIGDLNSDGIINIIDVVSLVNIVLNNDIDSNADINNDGAINIIDIVMLVNIILD